jgi:hypothetical protein
VGVLVIEAGSTVVVKHRDGSKLVAHARGDGWFETGHLPPFDQKWIDTYGWRIDSVEAPVTAEERRLAKLLESTDHDWTGVDRKEPYVARARHILGALRENVEEPT